MLSSDNYFLVGGSGAGGGDDEHVNQDLRGRLNRFAKLYTVGVIMDQYISVTVACHRLPFCPSLPPLPSPMLSGGNYFLVGGCGTAG